MEKKHLIISFLLFFFWEHSDTLWTCTYWLPVIVSCGYNSTYKYCYKKTQVKSFSHMPVVWVCAKTLTCCSSVAWVRAGALSELLSHGFAGPGGTVSEKWPKESIYYVLIPVQLDPMTILVMAWLDPPTLEQISRPGYFSSKERNKTMFLLHYLTLEFADWSISAPRSTSDFQNAVITSGVELGHHSQRPCRPHWASFPLSMSMMDSGQRPQYHYLPEFPSADMLLVVV